MSLDSSELESRLSGDRLPGFYVSLFFVSFFSVVDFDTSLLESPWLTAGLPLVCLFLFVGWLVAVFLGV